MPAPRAAARLKSNSFYDLVYRCVREIPTGRVATYGDVAAWLASPRAARAVGYALAARLPSDVPWHRVVNRSGGISVGGAVWRPEEQLRRLRSEKVRFDKEQTCSLATYRFAPSTAQRRRWAKAGALLRSLRNL